MEEYRNKWNINMNTLGLADCEIKENLKVYGYAVKHEGKVKGYLFFDETKCFLSWYNAHCLSNEQISETSESVLQEVYTESDWNNCQKSMEQLYLKTILPQKTILTLESEHLRFSMICNGLLQGTKEDLINEDQLKQYGYGLIYWELDKPVIFFDNRMAVTFRKAKELRKQDIFPIYIRLKKENSLPIPVAEGRKMLEEIMPMIYLKEMYDVIQTYKG